MKSIFSACQIALTIGLIACAGAASAAQSLSFYDHQFQGPSGAYKEWADRVFTFDPTSGAQQGATDWNIVGIPWNRPHSSTNPEGAANFLYTTDANGRLMLLDLADNGGGRIWFENQTYVVLSPTSVLTEYLRTGTGFNGQAYYGSFTQGGGYLWVAMAGAATDIKIVRLNLAGATTSIPVAEQVTTITLGTHTIFGGLSYDNGSLWAIERLGNGSMSERLWRINVSSGTPVRTEGPRLVQLSPFVGTTVIATGMAYLNNRLWVIDTSNRMYDFDPATIPQNNTVPAQAHRFSLPWLPFAAPALQPLPCGLGVVPTGLPPISTVTISAPDAAGSEAGANGCTIQVNRTGSVGDLDVYISMTPDARADMNIPWSGSIVRIPDGSSSILLSLPVVDDALSESSEQFLFDIRSNTAYRVGAPASVTLTVTDNDTIPVASITALDASAAEAGLDPGSFRVTLNTAVAVDTTIALSAPTGTASSGVDYNPLPGSVIILANTTSVTVPLTPQEDTTYEVAETVLWGLVAGSGYTVGAPLSATVTITDNDKPTVTVSASDASAMEGGVDNGSFTISRGVATGPDLVVTYTMSGSAASGGDYAALTGTATILAGNASVIVALNPADDAIAELPETAILTISANAASYVLGSPSTATVTIYDNESPVVTITASDASAKEGGSDNGKFTLTRLGLRSAALSVNLTRTGTATPASDYTALAAVVAIGTNLNTVDVPVTVLEDAVTEADETVIVTVAAGTGYAVGSPSTATVTIADNETPSLGIVANDATATEAGLTTGEFTISRLGDKAPALTINRVFTGSTASNGTDFQTLGTTIGLPAGQTTVKFLVTPIDDSQMEASETVITTLTSGTGYVVGTSNIATVTIADNDTQTVTVAMQTNAAEPATNGAFRFTRTGNTAGALAVTIALTTGTGYATNGVDHQTIPTTVNFTAGQLTVDVSVTVIDDANYEGTESVKLTIQPQSTYVVGSPSNATVALADNDKPTVTISLLDGNAAEPSDTGKFRLTRTGITTLGTLAVKYTMGGSAINGTDYTQLTGTATIAQGQASIDVTLTPLPDEVIEGVETAVMTIQADAANYNLGSPIVATVSIGSSIIETFAGQGPLGATPTPIMGGQATATGLAYPNGVAVDSGGNVFIVDIDAHSVFKVTPGGVISRVAGSANASSGFGGDGGQATAALLNGPQGIAVDGLGNLYIADTNNNRVRKVTPQGVISTFAGNGLTLFAGDNGQATAARVKQPSGLAVDANNNVFICDANNRVRKVTVATGVITTAVGNGTGTGSDGIIGDNGTATTASVVNPRGVAFDAAGNLYIADTGHNRVRKVTTAAIITTVAGTGTAGFGGDGGSAASALLSGPQGVAVSEFGEIFIADTDNNRVRKIEGGIIKTVGGNGLEDYTGNGGQATNAAINKPTSLAFDATGNLYIADSYNSSIRRLRAGISAITWMRSDGSRPLFAFIPGVRPEIR